MLVQCRVSAFAVQVRVIQEVGKPPRRRFVTQILEIIQLGLKRPLHKDIKD